MSKPIADQTDDELRVKQQQAQHVKNTTRVEAVFRLAGFVIDALAEILDLRDRARRMELEPDGGCGCGTCERLRAL